MASPETCDADVIVLGAGASGLAALYQLTAQGMSAILLERDALEGGLARTVMVDGCRFDIGGHRFLTKDAEIASLWSDLLRDELLVRERCSHVLYQHVLFRYPLDPFDVLGKLGLRRSLLALASFGQARLMYSQRHAGNLEEWLVARFGRQLFNAFFRQYTEKVWGMKCSDLSPEWAAQRIGALSLGLALTNALFGGRFGFTAKTLVRQFQYPRLGPGQLWQIMVERATAAGQQVLKGHECTRIRSDTSGVTINVRIADCANINLRARYLISSIPLPRLVNSVSPAADGRLQDHASRLRYRGLIVVCLVLENVDSRMPDNWLYLNDSRVSAARLQLYRNWSPSMASDSALYPVALEYLAWPHGDLWNTPDAELVHMAAADLSHVKLFDGFHIRQAAVVREPVAYPLYDHGYEQSVLMLRRFLQGHPRIQTVGRAGLHQYNNMDLAMKTGLLAARNLVGERHDLWNLHPGDSMR